MEHLYSINHVYEIIRNVLRVEQSRVKITKNIPLAGDGK